MSAAKRKYEFELSDETPIAATETDLKRAEDAWKARSDAAAAAVAMPSAPYCIRGDAAARAWFVEEAQITRSARPSRYHYGGYDAMASYLMRVMRGTHPAPTIDYTPYIQALDADEPSAKLEWVRVGRKSKGFFTYAKARKWLLEYLQPVRDEATFFRPDGSETTFAG